MQLLKEENFRHLVAGKDFFAKTQTALHLKRKILDFIKIQSRFSNNSVKKTILKIRWATA